MSDGADENKTIEDAYRELAEKFGEPEQLEAASGRVHVYRPDQYREGAGIAFVRHSSDEDSKTSAFKPMGQLRPVLDWLELHDRVPRQLVVTWGVSGAWPLRSRPDLQHALEELVRGGWPRFFAFREVSRMSRDVIVGEQLRRLAQRARVDLIMADTGVLTTDQDAFMLQILIAQAQIARENIRRASREGSISQREAGKWPGKPPFGFAKDKQGFLTLDIPRYLLAGEAVRQLPRHGKKVTIEYLSDPHDRAGLAEWLASDRNRPELVEWLMREGVWDRTIKEFRSAPGPTEGDLNMILAQPDGYATGRFVSEYLDTRYPARPVQIPPVVAISVHAIRSAQAGVAIRRGKGKPVHPLSGVPMFHYVEAPAGAVGQRDTLYPLTLDLDEDAEAVFVRHGSRRGGVPARDSCAELLLDANDVGHVIRAKLVALATILTEESPQTMAMLDTLEVALERAEADLEECSERARELLRAGDWTELRDELLAVVAAQCRVRDHAARRLEAARELPAVYVEEEVLLRGSMIEALDTVLERAFGARWTPELTFEQALARLILRRCLGAVVVRGRNDAFHVELLGPLSGDLATAATPVNPLVYTADLLAQFLAENVARATKRGTSPVRPGWIAPEPKRPGLGLTVEKWRSFEYAGAAPVFMTSGPSACDPGSIVVRGERVSWDAAIRGLDANERARAERFFWDDPRDGLRGSA